MKALLVTLLFIATCHAQEHNFVISNKAVVWENVFISNEANVPLLLKRHPRLSISSAEGKIYKGIGSLIRNTCKGSSAYTGNEFSFNFEVQVSSGKYRVSVYNIRYNLPNNQDQNLENYFIENNVLKDDPQSKLDIQCLNNYFNRIFSSPQVFKNKQ
ncbi:hypothetical protein CHU92_15440 [Flavobacterium cyanobacteriorum]|uniref:DUF4468 domain-containing protein n=1 Tax=Flavobacterium cyanobacteriorum TaxID=2022802 RepID=A0A255YTC0_9FLAO|nr:hypothetical protein [Flavobacterium cyanobacteriorum]OYQ31885.1 hypothetical protein CHU92_15440 [Flavobacterium cyanobacteriorum]